MTMISKICVNSQCAHFSVCAHGLEYAAVPADVEMIRVINPKYQVKDEEDKCRFFRTKQLVVYAYGFERETVKMPYGIYHMFSHMLMREFNRTDYYAMRNGSKRISPENQETIIRIAASLGYKFSAKPWDRIEKVEE